MPDDDRVIRIEEQLTHLQRDLGDLGEVVRALADDLARTRKQLSAVERRLHEHLSDSDSGSGDDAGP